MAPPESAKPGAEGEDGEILEAVRAENQRLSSEIVKLVETEHELLSSRLQLSNQVRVYRELHQLGKTLNVTFDAEEIAKVAAHFVVYQLNFERCIVMRCTNDRGGYATLAAEGFYDDDEATSIAELVLPAAHPFLVELEDGAEHKSCRWSEEATNVPLEAETYLAEHITMRLGGQDQPVSGFLICGNSREGRESFQAVADEGAWHLELANLSAQVTIALNNAAHYQALKEERNTLEVKVEERTRELSESNTELGRSLETLRRTQEELIRQHKHAALGDVVAGVAHELRNPLNFINNFSRLGADCLTELAEEIKDAFNSVPEDVTELLETAQDNIQRIRQHGSRVDSILNGMLLLQRRGDSQKSLTNINQLIEGQYELAFHGARSAGTRLPVNVNLDLSQEWCEIPLIPESFARVMLNLINNALYAIAKKRDNAGESYKGELVIATQPNDGFLEIRIRDNGVGIPAAVKDKIMDPFFTTKPAGVGTGLGLSISMEAITEGHGGSLEVESEENEFTEFLVRLPLR